MRAVQDLGEKHFMASKKTDEEIVNEMVLKYGFAPDEVHDAWRFNAAISKAVAEALKERR
jgi:hypothetical protein